MKAENMIIPQNARIVWNGKNFNIEPEKLGRQIDIEKAVDFAIAQLSNGGGEVYFTIITAHKPEVTTVLIGASKPEQILSNLKAAEKQRTTEMEAEELALIEKAVNLYHASVI